jgi:hypothetical protein
LATAGAASSLANQEALTTPVDRSLYFRLQLPADYFGGIIPGIDESLNVTRQSVVSKSKAL